MNCHKIIEIDTTNKICIVCLEEENNEIDNRLIEYNHCGKYNIHNKCLNNWKSNECIICRNKLIKDSNNSHDTNSSNDIITIMIEPNRNNIIKTCYKSCIIINLFGLIGYLLY